MSTQDLSGYNGGPDAITKHLDAGTLEWLAAARDADLHPDLVPYVEEGSWGEMLRHPLVYMVPLMLPGNANQMFERKKRLLFEAINHQDWHTCVWLHEPPYRLQALIDYVTGGRYDDGSP